MKVLPSSVLVVIFLFQAQETGEVTTTNSAKTIGARGNHLNFALPALPIPESLLSDRGIVVVPKDPENSLADFIEAEG